MYHPCQCLAFLNELLAVLANSARVWSLGLITASSHLPEDAHSAFYLVIALYFLEPL